MTNYLWTTTEICNMGADFAKRIFAVFRLSAKLNVGERFFWMAASVSIIGKFETRAGEKCLTNNAMIDESPSLKQGQPAWEWTGPTNLC